ncbi:MAG: hypothetical protein QXE64_01105 [Candidatus Pacearchaeota archaeon]
MISREVHQQIQKKIAEITKEIKDVPKVYLDIIELLGKEKLHLLQVIYKREAGLKLRVKREGSNIEEYYQIKIKPNLPKEEKELILLLTRANKVLAHPHLRFTTYMPEIHISKEESTKHHQDKSIKEMEETYEKYRDKIKLPKENMYAKLLT